MNTDLMILVPVMSGLATLIGVVVAVSRGISRTETAVKVLATQHAAIKDSIDALTEKVGAQNGRIGKSEVAIARLEGGK